MTCRVCGEESEKCYRCSECGADLVGREQSEDRKDIATDGGYDYHVRVSAPNRPEAFAQLVHLLDIGDEIVWNGRTEPFTVTEVEREESEPGGIGRFKRTLVVENQNRENGAEFRLDFEEGTDGDLTPFSRAQDARCVVQRQIGDNANVNPNGWGRCTDVESLAHVDPVESAQRDGGQAVADGGYDLEDLSTHDLVGRSLEDLGDQEAKDGIPTREVVDWVVTRTDLASADIEDAIEWLHNHGHVYEPRKDYLRRTDPDAARWSP